MKNILLISTIYPLPKGNRGTSVCHFFTREWIKLGYNVQVVYINVVFPRIYHFIAKIFKELISSRTGALVYDKRHKYSEYVIDNVPVTLMSAFKYIPHGRCTQKSIDKIIDRIVNNNTDNNFVPDIIIGHFPNPQVEVLFRLKEIYNHSKSILVMHGDNYCIKRIYKDNYKLLFKSIDVFGFRSVAIKKDFEDIYGKQDKSFLCYSGIPEKYITNKSKINKSKLEKFLFIGELIQRKFPISLLESVQTLYKNENYSITYIGDGYEKQAILKRISYLNILGKVNFTGKIPRDCINDYLDEADCFVMISKEEAFGLVYLEAMARGCITIASRNEGVDGIIIDGINGFLCDAGNTEELKEIIIRINNLSIEEKNKISQKAIETVRNLTDSKVALDYINTVISI